MDSDSTDETSSEYSTESSEDDDMEIAEINDSILHLPQGLCEHKNLFQEVLSIDTWNSLSETDKKYLENFLPTFPENDQEEKCETLRNLFEGDIFKFSNPIEQFHDQLKAGYFRPDIAHMRKIINQLELKEARYRFKKFKEKLKWDVIQSQRKLLYQVSNTPPGQLESSVDKMCINPDINNIAYRTKKRYYQVLVSIQTKMEEGSLSSDDNYPEGPNPPMSRKQKRHMNGIRNSFTSSDPMVLSTMSNSQEIDLERHITTSFNPFYINDEAYKKLLFKHKRRRISEDPHPKLVTKGIAMDDVIHRTQLPYLKPTVIKRPKKKLPHKETFITPNQSPEPQMKNILSVQTSHSELETDSDSTECGVTKVLSNNSYSISGSPVRLPVDKKQSKIITQTVKVTKKISESTNVISNSKVGINSHIDEKSDKQLIGKQFVTNCNSVNGDLDRPCLIQDLHANFLSLLRDIICSTNEHRMSYSMLYERLKMWQENPITPLNEWYSTADNWLDLITPALNFLCGNAKRLPDDFVPYIEHKSTLNVFQWIGAGRDSDNLMGILYEFWMEHRNDDLHKYSGTICEKSLTPPPPRCPTNWTVRKWTADEISDFQEQERNRYENPHKAFTYRCNGYESVVAPLKGIYNPTSTNSKARGHLMLNADRPNFVTILSLVRDATARLPNGEGTRADICELLKYSQYISTTAPDNVLQSVVSGALDRMHTQFDPCVKYDSRRKMWMYLHRNRSEDDFEKIHQQYQNVIKPKLKKLPRNRTKPESKKLKTTESCHDLTNNSNIENGNDKNSPSYIVVNAANKEKLTTDLIPSAKLNNSSSISKPQIPQLVSTKAQASTKPKPVIKVIGITEVKPEMIQPNSEAIVKSACKRSSTTIPHDQKQIVPITPKIVSKNNCVKHLKRVRAENKKTIIDGGQFSETTTITTSTTAIATTTTTSVNCGEVTNLKNTTVSETLPTPTTIRITPSDVRRDSFPDYNIQIKSHTSLTPTQQQQIIQTIKQKLLPANAVINTQPQLILKSKSVLPIKSTLQTESNAIQPSTPKLCNDSTKSNQAPVVAKVVTNAAGQVISVESLLTPQKQSGQLPQGATLRVAGGKTTAGNLIQITNPAKTATVTQYTVATQNNIITVNSPAKLVVATQSLTPSVVSSPSTTILKTATAAGTTTTTTTTTTTIKPISSIIKNQATVKMPTKVAQHLISAKLTPQTVDTQKSSKLLVAQQSQMVKLGGKNITLSKPVTLNVAGTPNTIRMVNPSNLNLTRLAGKPLFLATKNQTLSNIQGQNVILQTQPATSGEGAGSIVLHNANSTATNATQTAQNVVIGTPIKVQTPQVIFNSNVKSPTTTNTTQGHIMLDGQPIRLQTTTNPANSGQRVVLANQQQSGQIVAQQILLPAGFQGTAINIKALQGVKVIPISRGMQGRHILARVMNSSIIKAAQAEPEKSSEQPESSDK